MNVFVEEVCEVRLILDGSGGAHILVREVKEILGASVVGTNFDYEVVSHEAFSPNNVNGVGHFAGTVHQKITLIRMDPLTSTPMALVTGEGLGHLTVASDGNAVVTVERMQWTISPL